MSKRSCLARRTYLTYKKWRLSTIKLRIAVCLSCALYFALLLLLGCVPQERPLPTTIPLATLSTAPLTAVTTPSETPIPISTIVPTPQPSPTPPPADSGWQLLQTGLERRTINLYNELGQQTEQLFILRLEPQRFEFAVAYSPDEPKTLNEWQAETGALIVVNGGFFTETWHATGLTIVEGESSGMSYSEFGGMLAVTEDGVEVRSLVERPFDPAEPLRYALQSFPMLVLPGGQLGFPEEDGRPNRRTVVGMDKNGRLLLILAPWGSFTLHQLSRYLVESDLALDTALNLDGGTSTGLILTEPSLNIPSFTPLPVVVAIWQQNS